jgi:hypothetical protein
MEESRARDLIGQYLDGELYGAEAALFAKALNVHPDLEAELRAYERIESAARRLSAERAPAEIVGRVMAQVSRGRAQPSRRPGWGARARIAFAAAALLVIGFGLGRVHVGSVGEVDVESGVAASVSIMPLAYCPGGSEGAALRVVRLTYAPTAGSVERVSVAGSFNGWNSERAVMRAEEGVWSAVLVLPAGSHEYMFVEDGTRWVTDPLAARAREDGFGGRNAVLDTGV